MRRRIGGSAVVAGSLILSTRAALTQPQPPLTDPSLSITVTATRLDEACNGIARNINSAQFSFGAAEFADIARNYIILDHTQGWTFSTGAAYTCNAPVRQRQTFLLTLAQKF